MNFNLPQEDSSIIKVIGVGGGGSNAVNHMYRQGIRGVDFVVCNTDQQALDTSPVPKKIALGSSLTEGRGAGAQAEVGRNAAIENLDDIKEVLENNTKMVFITAGMGGGTGTGAAPVIAEAARELGILTVGIVTVPFTFEGKKRKLQADAGLEELKKHVDTVIVISNDKLREMYGNLKLSEAFGQADDVLTIAAKGIAEIITVEGYVNVDFEDVRTVMTGSGVAIMGSAITSGPDRAIKAVEQALASPLLNDNNIFGASNILLYISSGNEEVTMDEVAEITDYIQEEAGMDADVIWGNGTDESLGDQLSLTVIATGFTGEKLERVTGKENIIRHTLDTRPKNVVAPPTPAPTPTPTQNVAPTQPEVKASVPSGLTARPVLTNPNLQREVENKPQPELVTPPTNEVKAETPENVIKYTLTDDDTEKEEKHPPLMAFKVDEEDEQITAFLNAEAPEMIGIKEGEEFPLYDEDEDDEDEFEIAAEFDTELTIESTEETFEEELEVNELPMMEEQEEETEEEVAEVPTFSLFKKSPSLFNEEDDEVEDTKDDNVITTETPTEFEFELTKPTPTAESEFTKFSLYDETPETKAKLEDDLTGEPKLITRTETFATAKVEASVDAEEMQRKQQERMERLRTMNARFRSPTNLAELENVPAFKRRNVMLDDTPHSSESSVTRYQVSDTDEKDENGNRRGGLSDGNPFLHESVD
ncbi:MAG: cell division protein FtsZ [Bacteroidetes bacterium]|nr:MAG: cell division protein FtsZ [Bacteroidota bacterium]